MTRLVFLTIWMASLFLAPTCDLDAFWWTESLSPKAERAKVSLEGLDEIVNKALNDFRVPGLAIGIVVDNHVIYAKGFGMRDVENQKPTTVDTLFPLGSCTKPFTAFAIGCLIDDGCLSWDARVIDILPDFRLWDSYATYNLTLRDLISHRSGMARHDFMWYNSGMSRNEVFQKLRYLEPACNIRERFNYNNLMYLVAGLAVEKVSNESWEQFVTDRILKPLGMTKTNFSPSDVKKSSDYSQPYLERGGTLKKIPFRDITTCGPCGSINSNVTELCNWMRVHLNRGQWKQQPIISPAILQEMHTPQMIVSGYPERKEAHVRAYALGWYVQSYRGHQNLYHDGGIDGFTSTISILPGDNIGVIILSNKNLSSLPHCLCVHIFDRILELQQYDWLKESFDSLMKSKDTYIPEKDRDDMHRKKGTHPSHSLENYVGQYCHPGYGAVDIELVNGRLQATFNNIICLLDHWHYDVFSISEESEDLLVSRTGMKFTFHNNLEGDVDELQIPFESSAPDIVFKKQPDEEHASLAYLRQFVGSYESFYLTVEIELRNHTLVASSPGLPLYELSPAGLNEFNIKSLTGYTVRFLTSSDGKITEVLLIPPYGLAYSATPKRG